MLQFPHNRGSRIGHAPGGSEEGRGSYSWMESGMRAVLWHCCMEICGGHDECDRRALNNDFTWFNPTIELFLKRVPDFVKVYSDHRISKGDIKPWTNKRIHDIVWDRIHKFYHITGGKAGDRRRLTTEHPKQNPMLGKQVSVLEEYFQDREPRNVAQWTVLLM